MGIIVFNILNDRKTFFDIANKYLQNYSISGQSAFANLRNGMNEDKNKNCNLHT